MKKSLMPTLAARLPRVRSRRGCAMWAIALSVFFAHAARADDLTVSAAASLANAFGDIAQAFEQEHPHTHVVLNFAASDVLLKQIEQGAPTDVFASADEATMDRAAQTHRIDAGSRLDFAANTLVLIVPGHAGATPSALGDLVQKTYRRIAIGNPDSVPAGRYAQQALVEAKLWDVLRTRFVQAQNVRQALDYVARGEADAGFVYATDAASQAAKVEVAATVPTTSPVRYPAAVVGDCRTKPVACDFVRFLASPTSRATLAKYGFSAPLP